MVMLALSLVLCCVTLLWLVHKAGSLQPVPAPPLEAPPQAPPEAVTAPAASDQPPLQLSLPRSPELASFHEWMASKYTPPARLLGLAPGSEGDVKALKQRFHGLFSLKRKQAPDHELQCLAYAYHLLLVASKAQSVNVTVQAASNHTYNFIQLSHQREALLAQSGQLEQQLLLSQAEAARLQAAEPEMQQSLLLSRTENAQMRARVAELEEHASRREARIAVLRQRAKCAPRWYDALEAFVSTRCVRGADERVGYSELFESFRAVLKESAHTSRLEAPTQRELRAVIEDVLGYEYSQLHIGGMNCRGFRGLALAAQAPTGATVDPEPVTASGRCA